MKNYVAVFFGSAEAIRRWDSLEEATRKERERQGIAAWHSWAEEHRSSIVELGAPLGKTKFVNERGVSDSKNEITAYTVVRAESHEAAAGLFLRHPHFSIFPGDRIEVLECLPLPAGGS